MYANDNGPNYDHYGLGGAGGGAGDQSALNFNFDNISPSIGNYDLYGMGLLNEQSATTTKKEAN